MIKWHNKTSLLKEFGIMLKKKNLHNTELIFKVFFNKENILLICQSNSMAKLAELGR